MIAEQPYAISQLRVVGGHHSTVAKGPQILRWIKTESTKMPNRSGASSVILRADSLRRILDNIEFMTIGDLHDRIHLGNLSVQVHRHDGPRSIGYRHLNLIRINIEGERVDVYEDGFCAESGDRS